MDDLRRNVAMKKNPRSSSFGWYGENWGKWKIERVWIAIIKFRKDESVYYSFKVVIVEERIDATSIFFSVIKT